MLLNSWATLVARVPTLLSRWARSSCSRSWSVSEWLALTSSPIMGVGAEGMLGLGESGAAARPRVSGNPRRLVPEHGRVAVRGLPAGTGPFVLASCAAFRNLVSAAPGAALHRKSLSGRLLKRGLGG